MKKLFLITLFIYTSILYAQKNAKPTSKIVEYQYLEFIFMYHNGFYDWDWEEDPNATRDDYMYSLYEYPIIVQDTFYFTIDQTCLIDSTGWATYNEWDSTYQDKLKTFYDYVETPSKVSDHGYTYDPYYRATAHCYRNYYSYVILYFPLDSRVVHFLFKKCLQIVEARAVYIYNNNLPFEDPQIGYDFLMGY
jgi:hypothetical protein